MNIKENFILFNGLQQDKIVQEESFYREIFSNKFLGDFQRMILEFKSIQTGEYELFMEGSFNLEKIISFIKSDLYKQNNIKIYLRNLNVTLDFARLSDEGYKDERDYDKKYSNTSIELTFNENVIAESKLNLLYNFYKSFFLRFTIPISYEFGTIITDETTSGKYTNEIMFRHLNDFPFTGIPICWKMILGELDFDEDYTFEKISQTPALYNTPLLKQVDGRDYNLIELHTYKDFYNYES
ncbi:hypothetical protein, partial [Flammeovirga sp. SJP92]